MKKPAIYIVILVLLASLAVYLYLQDESSTLDPRYTKFGLKEVQKADTILISQGENRVKLHREAERWYVNENMFARDKAVEQFFNLLQDLRVEAPAPEKNREEINTLIRENPVRVKIYDGERLIRDYLVEDSRSKEGITYMMVRKSRRPFLMNLPGFKGDLAALFRAEPQYWRDRTLFDYTGLDMQRVKVTYPGQSESSFQLSYDQDEFRLESLSNDQVIQHFNSSKAARYFSYFSNVRFHSVIMDDGRLLDSLRRSQPHCTIEITDKKGNHRKLLTYRKESAGQKDAFGQASPYDLNYLYGRYQPSGEILLIKYTEIDPLLKEIDYFREN